MFLNQERQYSPDASTGFQLLYESEVLWNRYEMDMMCLEHKAIMTNNIKLYNEGVSDFLGKVKRWFQWLGAEFVRYVNKVIDFWSRQTAKFKSWMFNAEKAKKLTRDITLSNENFNALRACVTMSAESNEITKLVDNLTIKSIQAIKEAPKNNGETAKPTETNPAAGTPKPAKSTISPDAVKNGKATAYANQVITGKAKFLFEGSGPLTQLLLQEAGEQQPPTKPETNAPDLNGAITSLEQYIQKLDQIIQNNSISSKNTGNVDQDKYAATTVTAGSTDMNSFINFVKDGRVKLIYCLQKCKNDLVSILNDAIKADFTTEGSEVSQIKRAVSRTKEFISKEIKLVNQATNAFIKAVDSKTGDEKTRKTADTIDSQPNPKTQTQQKFLFESSDILDLEDELD